jgi:hypothetical protein
MQKVAEETCMCAENGGREMCWKWQKKLACVRRMVVEKSAANGISKKLVCDTGTHQSDARELSQIAGLEPCQLMYSTVLRKFPPMWYFYMGPPSSTTSEAVPCPQKSQEAKNHGGIVSTCALQRKWDSHSS